MLGLGISKGFLGIFGGEKKKPLEFQREESREKREFLGRAEIPEKFWNFGNEFSQKITGADQSYPGKSGNFWEEGILGYRRERNPGIPGKRGILGMEEIPSDPKKKKKVGFWE